MSKTNRVNYLSCWKSFVTRADEASLRELFHASYGTLLTYGIKMTGDSQLTQDAVQEVFLNLWKYRKNLQADVRVLPYLLKSLRNEILRLRKKFQAFQPLTQELMTQVFVPDELHIDALDGYQRNVVIDALNSLPQRQKEILYLRFYENLSYEDIASVLEIKYQSVVNQSFRAITKLRERGALKQALFYS